MTDLSQSQYHQQDRSEATDGVLSRPSSEMENTISGGDSDPASPGSDTPLFPVQQCRGFEEKWQSIQANFVDAPRSSVQAADALVTQTVETLASSFGDMRKSLEQTWEREGDVSTEELRLALQNYRSFFRRLLSL
jgi:hypothetical protein